MSLIDILAPDIGDFDEVTVIELMVKPGDTIQADQSLITVASDKASMEIPSSHAGIVKEPRVKNGDKVKQGSVVLTLEAAGAAPTAAAPAAAPAQAAFSPSNTPVVLVAGTQAAINIIASSYAGNVDLDCDLLVLGAGPGGYSAAFRAADLGLKVIIVKKGLFPWTASARAIANGRDEGVTKLLFDDSPEAHGHGKILGGGMVGTHAGDMIGEIALAIEMGADGRIKKFYGYLIGCTLDPSRMIPGYTRFVNGKGYFRSDKLVDDESNRVYGELYSEVLLYEHFIDRAALRLRVYKEKLQVQLS